MLFFRGRKPKDPDAAKPPPKVAKVAKVAKTKTRLKATSSKAAAASSTPTVDATSKKSKRGRKKKRRLIHDDFDDDDDDDGGGNKSGPPKKASPPSSKTAKPAAKSVANIKDSSLPADLKAAPADICKTSPTLASVTPTATTTTTTAAPDASATKAPEVASSLTPVTDLPKPEPISAPPPKPFRPNHIPAQLVSASAMATAKPTKFHRSLAFKGFKQRSENLKSGQSKKIGNTNWCHCYEQYKIIFLLIGFKETVSGTYQC